MSGDPRFEALLALARREVAPTPDVTTAVRSRLAAGRPAVEPPLALAWACVAAAVVLGGLGWQAWQTLASPWTTVLLNLTGWPA